MFVYWLCWSLLSEGFLQLRRAEANSVGVCGLLIVVASVIVDPGL